MIDTEFDRQIIDDRKVELLRAIFDPERKLETDDDLLELAKYVEDELDETNTFVDGDFDFGTGC